MFLAACLFSSAFVPIVAGSGVEKNKAFLHDQQFASGRTLQAADGPVSQLTATFVVAWLSKLTGVVNRDPPTVSATCPDDGVIALVKTSSDDVMCTNASPQVLECTTGDSVFSNLDLLDWEDGVKAYFTCTGSSEAALLPTFELAEQDFLVKVVGQYASENIVRGFSEPQMNAYQVCGDDLFRTTWCSPKADTLFGYCESSDFCNAVCYGVGCTDTCSFTIPALTTGVTSVSCKTTSVAQIDCQVPAGNDALVFEAENAQNLYVWERNKPFPGDETCCFTTTDARWTAWKQGVIMLQETGESPAATAVTYFDEGDYLAFGPIDFGIGTNCASVRLRYSRAAETHVTTGAWAKFEPTQEIAGVLFRLDSPGGPLVGELLVSHTDGYEVGEATIAVSGEHMLYVVGQGGRGVMYLDWIEISPGVSASVTSTAATPTISPISTSATTNSPTFVPTKSPVSTAAAVTSSPTFAPTGREEQAQEAPTTSSPTATSSQEDSGAAEPSQGGEVQTPSPSPTDGSSSSRLSTTIVTTIFVSASFSLIF